MHKLTSRLFRDSCVDFDLQGSLGARSPELKLMRLSSVFYIKRCCLGSMKECRRALPFVTQRTIRFMTWQAGFGAQGSQCLLNPNPQSLMPPKRHHIPGRVCSLLKLCTTVKKMLHLNREHYQQCGKRLWILFRLQYRERRAPRAGY